MLTSTLHTQIVCIFNKLKKKIYFSKDEIILLGKKSMHLRELDGKATYYYVGYGQTTLKQIVKYFVLSRNIW